MQPVQKVEGPDDREIPTVYSSYHASGAHWASSTAMCLIHRVHRTMEGWVIPNFRRRVADGELLLHTPFEQTESISEQLGGGLYVEFDGNGTLRYQQSPMYYPISYTNWALSSQDKKNLGGSTSEQLVQEAAARIYSSGHDAGTFLAEIGKLRKMVFELSKRMRALSRDKTYKAAAKAWLEGRYGWRTLVYDLDTLHQAVTEFDDKRRRFSERVGYTIRDVDTSSTLLSLGNVVVNRVTTIETEVSRRGSVTADISPSRFRFNPITTAWELIPWSFVVDWFVGVGSALEATSFELTSQAYVASAGYKVTRTKKTSARAVEWLNGRNGTYRHDTISTYSESKREPTSLSLKPQLRVKLDEWKVVDLAALATNFIRK